MCQLGRGAGSLRCDAWSAARPSRPEADAEAR
jgi:hypothetical protein